MNELKTWYDNEVYNKQIEIFFRDCDINRKIKLSTVMGYASDIAGDDYADRGLTHYKLVEAKQVFLLARYHYRFFRMPSVGEIVTFRTWEKGVESGYVLRDYEILDSNNEVCILISSTWIIVNPETRKIIRPKDFSLKKINISEYAIDCEPCVKISFDDEKLKELGERVVYYSELDANGHLNNAVYGSIANDFLPCNFRDKEIYDFYINYNREVKLDETIKLFGYEENKEYYMIGKLENKLCFTCKFVFK